MADVIDAALAHGGQRGEAFFDRQQVAGADLVGRTPLRVAMNHLDAPFPRWPYRATAVPCWATNQTVRGKTTMRMISSRRTLLQAAGGLAGILATGRAPAFAQATPKKMQIAAVNPVPESGAIALDWFAKALTERTK